MYQNSASSSSRGVEIAVFVIGTIGVILSALFFSALAVVLGATSFWGRSGTWAIPLLGIPATGALYLLCAFVIA